MALPLDSVVLTPPHQFSTCFDTNGVVLTAPHSFRRVLTCIDATGFNTTPLLFDMLGGLTPLLLITFHCDAKGEGSTSPFLSTPFDTGRVQHPPVFFAARFDTTGEGSTPPLVFSTRFDVRGGGLTPPPSFDAV